MVLENGIFLTQDTIDIGFQTALLLCGQKGNIPDIHPAYCGLRGLTLSSHRQHHAWDKLVAAGLKQVMIKRHAN